MKTRIIALSVLSFGILALNACAPKSATSAQVGKSTRDLVPGNQAAHYKDLRLPPNAWTPPNPLTYRHLLGGKTPIYIYADSSLPTVSLSVVFKTPGIVPSAPRNAAQSLLGSMLVHGGTQDLSGEALADSLEFLAASLSASPGERTMTLSLKCLKRDLPALLRWMQDAVLRPGMDTSVFRLRQQQMAQSLNHRWDRPAPISEALSYQVLYGKHPQGWLLRPEEVQGLKPQDLLAELKTLMNPQKMWIGVAGDVEIPKIKEHLALWIQAWPQPQPSEVIAPPEPKLSPGLYVVDRPTQQTQVKWVAPFVKRPHPDFYAASVAAYLLGGGGFGSRLVDQIRTKEGLAYSVWARAGSDEDQVSTVEIGLQTKAVSTARALELTRAELERFIATGPDSVELAGAKKALIDGLVGSFDSPESIVSAFLQNEVKGRPLDHFAKYGAQIQALTAADVQEAARKWFAPERFSVTLVGPWQTIVSNDPHSALKAWKEPSQWSLDDLEKR
jgi:zinc protease